MWPQVNGGNQVLIVDGHHEKQVISKQKEWQKDTEMKVGVGGFLFRKAQ